MSKFDEVWKPLDKLIVSDEQIFNDDLTEMWESLEKYLIERKLIDKYDCIGVREYS